MNGVKVGVFVEEVNNTNGSVVSIREAGTQVLASNGEPVPLLHVTVRPFDGYAIEQAMFLRVVRKWLQAQGMLIVPLERIHFEAQRCEAPE